MCAPKRVRPGRGFRRTIPQRFAFCPVGGGRWSGEPSLAVDQWQIAQVDAVMLDQVEGKVRVLSLCPRGGLIL